MTVLAISKHVDRSVSKAQFGDGGAFNLVPGLQLAYRNLHERRAGVGCQDELLIADGIRHECSNRRIGFVALVGAVEDFDVGALGRVVERVRDATKVRRKYLVRESRN